MSMSRPGGSSISLSGEETKAYTLQPIPPQVFGKYTLIGKLGHGGMAEVLIAAISGKGGFQKLVVLKRLHPQLEAEPSFVEMFLDEARLAAQLDHPHCVQTLDVGDVDGQHFLAMEYLDGQGVERLLRWSAQSQYLLPVEVMLRVVADAADGLSYAHHLADYSGRPLGVVHRDVSPQNLFVTYTGVVKVLDFGIAKAETNLVQTRAGVIKGKYAYIAPEQARGAEVDPRADVWSLGVVLWECLTSRRLFKSTNDVATLHETLHAEIPLPSTINPAVPAEVDAIVLGALERDLERRYQSAADFKAAIESYLSTLSSPPGRDAIAALMTERFEEVQRSQREKVAQCFEVLEQAELDVAMKEAAEPEDDDAPFGSARTMPIPASVVESVSSVRPRAQPSQPDRERSGRLWKAAVLVLLLLLTALTATLLVLLQGAVPERQVSSRSEPPQARSTSVRVSSPASTEVTLPASAETSGRPRPSPVSTPSAESVDDRQPESPEVGSPESGAPENGSPESGAPENDSPHPDSTELADDSVLPATVPDRVAETPAISRTERSPRRPRNRTRHRSQRPSPSAPAVEEPPALEPGFLSLVTSPWTVVRWRGRDLGETPLVRIELPAGRHELELVNDEAGIRQRYSVEIEAGRLTSRRLGLR